MTGDHRRALLNAILLTCSSYLFFSIGDAASKLMAAKFHFSQIMCTGALMTIGLMCVYGVVTRDRKAFTTKKMKIMLARAALSQGVGVCNITALPHVHLSTFYALVFTSPFWVALMTAGIFKDRLTVQRGAVILAGFAVVLGVFRPGGGGDVYTLLVLAGAFFYSAQLMFMRLLGRGESRVFMVLCGSTMTLVTVGPLVPAHFIMPELWEWGVFFIMTAIGVSGLFCISYAFQTAPSPSALAPYHYTQIVWGALLGWLVFKEVPEPRVVAGAAAIIIMGLYLIYSETRRSRVPDAEKSIEL